MATEYVLIHKDSGLFVCSVTGLPYFTTDRGHGQEHVCTFESEQQAFDIVETWNGDHDLAGYRCHPVATENPCYASIEELDAAGLQKYTGGLKQQHLVNIPEAV